MSLIDEYEGVCPECGGDITIADEGMFRGKIWQRVKCDDCNWWQSDEPDWDNLNNDKDE